MKFTRHNGRAGKNGSYIATKKVGKNNPKAEEIKADNEIRMEWNRTGRL